LALGTPLGVIALAAAALVAALGASKLVRVSRAVAAGYVGMLVAQVALRGIALWLCLRLFGADVGRVDAVGAACLGYALGFLAVFAPGGVGVREAAIGGSLAAAAGAAPAVGAAVVLRLLEVVVELGFLAITRLIRLPNAATTPATTV
jgi:glycosyltransferase 2 family protein